MPKKRTIILLCAVTIVAAALLTVTQLLADEKPLASQNYRAITTYNELEVAGLKKRYFRNPDDGCVSRIEFYNDPAKCDGNNKCLDILKDKPSQPKWIAAIKVTEPPGIWGEILVGAGSTKGESDVCGDWRFTLAGSPGWDCDHVGVERRKVCSCIGFYVGPPDYPGFDHCCDPNRCTPRPF